MKNLTIGKNALEFDIFLNACKLVEKEDIRGLDSFNVSQSGITATDGQTAFFIEKYNKELESGKYDFIYNKNKIVIIFKEKNYRDFDLSNFAIVKNIEFCKPKNGKWDISEIMYKTYDETQKTFDYEKIKIGIKSFLSCQKVDISITSNEGMLISDKNFIVPGKVLVMGTIRPNKID